MRFAEKGFLLHGLCHENYSDDVLTAKNKSALDNNFFSSS
jgi:hypothetical protein